MSYGNGFTILFGWSQSNGNPFLGCQLMKKLKIVLMNQLIARYLQLIRLWFTSTVQTLIIPHLLVDKTPISDARKPTAIRKQIL